MAKDQKKNRLRTRKEKVLGGYFSDPIVQGIEEWIQRAPKRDISDFIREAAREKLHREGILFHETKQQMKRRSPSVKCVTR